MIFNQHTNPDTPKRSARFSLPLSGRFSLALLALMTIAPHLLYFPKLTSIYLLLAWALATLLLQLGPKLILLLKLFLTAAGIAAISGSFALTDIGSMANALLCLVIAIKPLESGSNAAQRNFVLICYFSAVAFFFNERSDLWLVYFVGVILLLTAALHKLEFDQQSVPSSVKSSAKLLLQAAPLALILFFVFPRIADPLWQWNPYDQAQQSGISEQVELGDLGKLALSDDVAFKVQFDSKIPDIADMYWRGPVFYFSDGRVWDSDFYQKQRLQAEAQAALTSLTDAQLIRYQITQEANYKNWLVALDRPVTSIRGAHLSQEYQLISASKNTSTKRYRVSSALDYQTPADPEPVYLKALQMPDRKRMARQTRALGASLRAQAANAANPNQAIVQQALEYFSQNPFYYTLDATKSGANPIDAFMFGSRRGYCTHYASAMTMLLRAADVPARMVAGYRGGEWNAVGQFLLVKQKHAHAWVEAWIDGYGWVRIDPTAVIPSHRVMLDQQLNLSGSVFSGSIAQQLNTQPGFERFTEGQAKSATANTPAQTLEDSLQVDLLGSLSNQIQQSLNYASDLGQFFWEAWIRDFNYQRQQSLFSFSSITQWLALAGLITLFLTVYLGYLLRLPERIRQRQPPLTRIYQQLLRKLAKQGVTVAAHNHHRAILKHALKQGGFDEAHLSSAFATYERLRYAKPAEQISQQEIKAFRQQVKKLVVKPSL